MQNQLENKAYAGFFVRLMAYAVDSIIASLAVGIVKFPFSIAAMAGVDMLTKNFIFDYSFLDVFGYIGVAAYFVLLTYFSHSTVGKMLFRLEVTTDKKEWTFVNVLYRETIGRFLSSLLCIGYFAILVQKDKQGFHDMLCDTHVVYKDMIHVPKAVPNNPAPMKQPVEEKMVLSPMEQPLQEETVFRPIEQPVQEETGLSPIEQPSQEETVFYE